MTNYHADYKFCLHLATVIKASQIKMFEESKLTAGSTGFQPKTQFYAYVRLHSSTFTAMSPRADFFGQSYNKFIITPCTFPTKGDETLTKKTLWLTELLLVAGRSRWGGSWKKLFVQYWCKEKANLFSRCGLTKLLLKLCHPTYACSQDWQGNCKNNDLTPCFENKSVTMRCLRLKRL